MHLSLSLAMVKLPQALLALTLLAGVGPLPTPGLAQQQSQNQFPGPAGKEIDFELFSVGFYS
jgi:hypothetical protein